MKTENDIKNCMTDGIPNEELKKAESGVDLKSREALKKELTDRLTELKNGWERKGKIPRQELARADEISRAILALDILPTKNAGDFAPMESENGQPVATSRIEKDIDWLSFRMTRIEKTISLLIKGGTIHLQEEEGWGITREELDFLRQAYKDIREENHYSDDYIKDDHQEGSETTRSNDDHQG